MFLHTKTFLAEMSRCYVMTTQLGHEINESLNRFKLIL